MHACNVLLSCYVLPHHTILLSHHDQWRRCATDCLLWSGVDIAQQTHLGGVHSGLQAGDAARSEEQRRKEAEAAEKQARVAAELARNREVIAECAPGSCLCLCRRLGVSGTIPCVQWTLAGASVYAPKGAADVRASQIACTPQPRQCACSKPEQGWASLSSSRTSWLKKHARRHVTP